MYDSIPRPIDAIKPSTYQSKSPDALIKDMVFRVPAYAFRIRAKGCGEFVANAHSLVNAPMVLRYEYDEDSPGLYWSKTKYSYSLQMDAAYSYRINPILRLPGDPRLYGQKPRGSDASMFLDYLDPKVRRLPSLSRLIAMEKRRLAAFQKRYRTWEVRQEAKKVRYQIKFLNRQQQILIGLRKRIEELKSSISRSEQIAKEKGKAFPPSVATKVKRQRATLSRLLKLESKVSMTTFKWTNKSSPPVYKPKYYDLSSATALYPYALPNGIRTASPHPTDHWKISGHSDSDPILVNCSVTSGSSSARRSAKCTFAMYPEGILWRYNKSVYLDRGSVFSYDATALEQAVRSIRMRKIEANNLPLWLVELRDTNKTLESCIRLYRAIRGFRLSGRALGELAKAASGADLARKFGAEPAVKDFLDIVQQGLAEQTKAWKQFLWWLSHRGKIVSTRRRFANTVDTIRRPLSKSYLSRRPNNLDDASIRGKYVYDWVRGGPDIVPPQTQHTERDVSARDVWDQVVPIVQASLISQPLSTTTMASSRMHVTVWYSYDFYDEFGWLIDDTEAKRRAGLDRLGLFLNAKTAWELIPFSFIIDWFTNVSQLLDKIEIRNLRPSYTVYGAMLSRLDVEQTVLWADDTHLSFPSGPVRRTERRYRRMFVEIPVEWFATDSDIRVRWKSPTWWHLITAFELGGN